MLKTLKNLWRPQRIKELTDIRNVGFYIFAVVVLAIAWSGVKTIQSNYELQKQVSVLKQQNEVLRLSNRNTELQSQFYETDQYLELSARQNLGLAASGETVWIVPKAVALKHIDQSLNAQKDYLYEETGAATASGFRKNFQDWRNFLLGREVQNNL